MLLLWAFLTVTAHAAPLAPDTRVLDDFSDAKEWLATASDEVKAQAVPGPRGGTCLRYDFGHVSGYAVLRRHLLVDLPPNYALNLRLSGHGEPNALQVKLVDGSGDNVWWMNRPGYVPPAQPTDLLIRQRQIAFAWGPATDHTLRRAENIEIVVASGSGGQGELCFEQLTLRTLPAPGPLPKSTASASSSSGVSAGSVAATANAATSAALAIDADEHTAWRSAGGGVQQWQLDLGAPRELAGLLLRWAPGGRPSDYALQFSDDAEHWRTVREVHDAGRDLMPIWLPTDDAGNDTRYLRLVMQRGPKAGYALAEFEVMGPAQWANRNDALRSLAIAAPKSRYPRGLIGEQSYWTIAATDAGGASAALISEDGAIEPRKGGPSIEPFVIDEAGHLTGWADVKFTHGLRDGYLPLPQLKWTAAGHTLALEAGAEGTRDAARLIARYTLTNTGDKPRTLTLALAVRPWQVNPPTQFLNTPGGASSIRQLGWQAGQLQVDGKPWLRAAPAPSAVGAVAFDQGDALEMSLHGDLPALKTLDDPLAFASAALRWRLTLAPGESRSVAIELPLVGTMPASTLATAASANARLDAIAAKWRERLNRVSFTVPPEAQRIVDSARSAVAHILMSRDGPSLRPGTRSYARSWIRDGAMMVAGLLRVGEVEASREFVQWYAGFLFANGKVPCCVDGRGADPVAENDSSGEFIYAVAELWRHTHDRALLESLWPSVESAAVYLEKLHQSERKQPGPFYGLMPASISHEGYSAKPMHSYWDDFWALAGYRDAAALARALGHTERADELAFQRDQFADDLAASLRAAIEDHHIDYLPGAAELGDFDPSSSTLIFSPAGAEGRVSPDVLETTWNRYWRESVMRTEGTRPWADYTPYELRSVSALLRLNRPERAHAMLDFFFGDQRPAGWNQWAEVVGHQPREPRFLGDMPHAWISSDYIRSALDLFAYERPSDDALVLGAGVPAAWWEAGPVAVEGLSTAHGRLDLRIERTAPKELRVRVGPGLQRPPGGLWLAWADASPPPAFTSSGQKLSWQGRLLPLPDVAQGEPIELRLSLP